jgi:hypothetical protein
MSLTSRFAQIALRPVSSNILGCIKTGEVFPDNFVCRVSFNLLCTGIPCHDVAGRVEHVDGVFFDAIHQNVELFGRLV